MCVLFAQQFVEHDRQFICLESTIAISIVHIERKDVC